MEDDFVMIDEVVKLPTIVIDKPELPAENNFQARSLEVRSKLGGKLYDLITPDLPAFYEAVRDAALARSEDIPKYRDGTPSRSYGNFLTAHRRMFIDLMKMANADVSVGQTDFKGDINSFRAQLEQATTTDHVSTEDLRSMVEKAEELLVKE